MPKLNLESPFYVTNVVSNELLSVVWRQNGNWHNGKIWPGFQVFTKAADLGNKNINDKSVAFPP
jgi:hypothetical protein